MSEGMISRFAVTLFVSATLLFVCQPMIARLIVPSLGGAPAVWIVCSLCFQALVLLGYVYAHVLSTRVSLRLQIVLQLVLIGAAMFALPMTVDERLVSTWTARHGSFGLLALLLSTVGLPFFVLSTTSPLLQRWASRLGDDDPYRLYAASNAGSAVALIGYPFVVEPWIGLSAQQRVFQIGYVGYAALVVTCAFTVVRNTKFELSASVPAGGADPAAVTNGASAAPATPLWRQRLVWIALAFAPSSLLLGATQYITTDLASIPLLWVAPLALYLASFVLAFASRPLLSDAVASRVHVMLASLVALTMLAGLLRPAWVLVTAHLALVLVGSYVCHRALANRRPEASRLTEFYLFVSLGGVLGGSFNGLLAPVVFDDLFEYPLAIGLSCLALVALQPKVAGLRSVSSDVLPPPVDGVEPEGWRPYVRDAASGVGLSLVSFGLVRLAEAFDVDSGVAFTGIFAIPVFVAYVWSKRPVRFAVALAGILLVSFGYSGSTGDVLSRTRDFFGVLKVTRSPGGHYRTLVSGRTVHGKQKLDLARRDDPIAYYHPTGPAGDVLGPVGTAAGELPTRRIGIIGLGVGELASYARTGDVWTFFELNPTVVDIARRDFTFLADAEKRATTFIELGDARLRLRDGAAARFDVLVLDAFTSDAIPVHLLTREALEIYRRALVPDGILLAHVSNRHVRLPPVFGALARDAKLAAFVRDEGDVSREDALDGKASSIWVIVGRAEERLGAVAKKNVQWKPLSAPPTQLAWTDDFVDMLGAMTF